MSKLYSKFSFKINQKGEGRSRVCEYITPHGNIETPAFIFCATKAAMKGVQVDYKPISPDVLKQTHLDNVINTQDLENTHLDNTVDRQENNNVELGKYQNTVSTQIILSNTYHLMVQPGLPDLIESHGGLHGFMHWKGPMMTDSGGFQIFSLGHGSVASEIKGKGMSTKKTLTKITKNHAEFRSYVDGSKHILSPEKSIEVQRKLGADFCFVLDECTPFHVDKKYTEKSMYLSHDWEERSLKEFENNDKNHQNNNKHQVLYGISQGGVYKDLRKKSCEFLSKHNFWGNAIGGSLGATQEEMYEIVDYTTTLMHQNNEERPIHLLGIGKIRDIFEGVKCGVDTFDCVHPTRIARHGCAIVKKASNFAKNNHKLNNDNDSQSVQYSNREFINLTNSRFVDDQLPIQEGCKCDTCQKYTRAYIHYLFKAKEMFGMTAITTHNIFIMNQLMSEIRECIKNKKSLDSLQELWI